AEVDQPDVLVVGGDEDVRQAQISVKDACRFARLQSFQDTDVEVQRLDSVLVKWVTPGADDSLQRSQTRNVLHNVKVQILDLRTTVLLDRNNARVAHFF